MSERIASRATSLDLVEIGRGGADAGVAVEAPAPRPTERHGPLGRKAHALRLDRVRLRGRHGLLVGALSVLRARDDRDDLHAHRRAARCALRTRPRDRRAPRSTSLAFKFFFVPPRFGFIPTDIQYLLTFAVMLAVGVLIGQLAGRLRFQARVASHREKRARTLYEFARDLAQLQHPGPGDRDDGRVLSNATSGRARRVLVPDSTGTLVSPTGRGMTNPFDSTAAQWAYDQAQPAGAGTDTLSTNEYLFLPLKSPTRTRGVLAVRAERTRDLFIPEQRHQFEIFATLVATALERVHYVDVARDALLMAGLQKRGDGARTRAPHPSPTSSRPRFAAGRAHGQARGQGRGAARPSAGGGRSRPRAARARERDRQRGTAHARGHAGDDRAPARCAARCELSVEDNGPGLPQGARGRGLRVVRARARSATRKGAGLGLAISRAIVEAHGGKIRAEPGEAGGTRIVLTLPVASTKDRK